MENFLLCFFLGVEEHISLSLKVLADMVIAVNHLVVLLQNMTSKKNPELFLNKNWKTFFTLLVTECSDFVHLVVFQHLRHQNDVMILYIHFSATITIQLFRLYV